MEKFVYTYVTLDFVSNRCRFVRFWIIWWQVHDLHAPDTESAVLRFTDFLSMGYNSITLDHLLLISFICFAMSLGSILLCVCIFGSQYIVKAFVDTLVTNQSLSGHFFFGWVLAVVCLYWLLFNCYKCSADGTQIMQTKCLYNLQVDQVWPCETCC